MRRLFLSGLGVALAVLLASAPACRRDHEINDPSKIKVGIVFDIGGKDDRSFNAAAWAGVYCAATGKTPDNKETCGKAALPVIVRDIEPGNPVSIEPALRAFAERGFDLVIGIGFAQGSLLAKVAKDYPQVNFAIVDGVVFEDDGKTPMANVASLVFKEHEGSYLVGMLAARASKTNTIGFLGGMDIPLIHRFAKGYEQGAQAVNPNIRVVENYVGNTDAAWNNPGKGKEISLVQIGKGVDVIFTAAGNSGLGAFDAVEQAGTDDAGRAKAFVIGVDSNQNGIKPGFVLTSMVKRVDNAVYQIIEEVLAKRGTGGKVGGFHVYGLDKDGVGYALDDFNRPLIAPATLQEVDAARQKIINGETKVVDAMTQ